MATKKKITKEELRRAMMEAKKKRTVKKIESPLARYNELDQLTCVICKTVVRNEAIWPVHLNSKLHKDNIELARKAKLKLSAPPQPTASNKRPSSFEVPQEPKKIKSILKNAPPPPPPPPPPVPTNTNSSLPSDFFDNSFASNSTIGLPKLNITNGINSNAISGSSEEKVTEDKDNKEGKDNKENGHSTLPEGFFDDPIMDAKARNVEYKDPVEEEWERFQKEIKEETAQSEQIIGDDQEEAATERQLDEVEEQLRNWNRVMDLVKQKELVQTADKKQDDTSSSDEEDFDEFLDWRAKKSYRE